jgi:hypothetical protein
MRNKKPPRVRIHFFDFLSHKSTLWDAIWVKLMLVTESYRFERKDRFARLVHRFDGFLKTRRGCGRAELTVAPNDAVASFCQDKNIKFSDSRKRALRSATSACSTVGNEDSDGKRNGIAYSRIWPSPRMTYL